MREIVFSPKLLPIGLPGLAWPREGDDTGNQWGMQGEAKSRPVRALMFEVEGELQDVQSPIVRLGMGFLTRHVPPETAMIELTAEQQQALDSGSGPLRLLDPRTNQVYILLGADVYQGLRGLLGEDDGVDMRQVAVLVERAMRDDDAADPTLAFYQQRYGKNQ